MGVSSCASLGLISSDHTVPPSGQGISGWHSKRSAVGLLLLPGMCAGAGRKMGEVAVFTDSQQPCPPAFHKTFPFREAEREKDQD